MLIHKEDGENYKYFLMNSNNQAIVESVKDHIELYDMTHKVFQNKVWKESLWKEIDK